MKLPLMVVIISKELLISLKQDIIGNNTIELRNKKKLFLKIIDILHEKPEDRRQYLKII